MDDEISILIRWELNELREKVKRLRDELNTLMIHRNTAALRTVVLQKAGLPYPGDVDDLNTLDEMVEKKVLEIKFVKRQITAWETLMSDLNNPQIQNELRPAIRTIEL